MLTFYLEKKQLKKWYNQLFWQSVGFKSISNGHVQTGLFDIWWYVNREKIKNHTVGTTLEK